MRSLHTAGLAYFDLGIARVLEEWGQPANFEFRATFNEHIGRPQLHDKARTRIDEVRILRRLRHHGHVNFVAANRTRDRTEIGKSGNNVELRVFSSGNAPVATSFALPNGELQRIELRWTGKGYTLVRDFSRGKIKWNITKANGISN